MCIFNSCAGGVECCPCDAGHYASGQGDCPYSNDPNHAVPTSLCSMVFCSNTYFTSSFWAMTTEIRSPWVPTDVWLYPIIPISQRFWVIMVKVTVRTRMTPIMQFRLPCARWCSVRTHISRQVLGHDHRDTEPLGSYGCSVISNNTNITTLLGNNST
jgi:hypothetical protein